jgi:hypothetical protein
VKLAALCLLLTIPVSAALIGSVAWDGPTSPSINTTNVTLACVFATGPDPFTPAIADSYKNVWHLAGKVGSGSLTCAYGAITAGPGHAVTITNAPDGGGYEYVFMAFSGFTGPVGQYSLNDDVYADTIQAGPVTPTGGGELVIVGLDSANAGPALSIDSGLTIAQNIYNTESGASVAYSATVSAMPMNPTWKLTLSSFVGALTATFPALATPTLAPITAPMTWPNLLTVTAAGSVLTIGGGCTVSSPCNVRIGSTVYAFTYPVTATLAPSDSGTAYVYIDGATGLTIVGSNMSPTCAGGCVAQAGITNFPTDSLPIAIWTVSNGTWSPAGIDVRALLSR